jgi:hypothetical protein
MITHFEVKEVNKTFFRRAWEFRFIKGHQLYKGTYKKDGTIEWGDEGYSGEDIKKIEKQIHELMDFHVYS